MRKIILFMVISLDGFVAGPEGELNWENQDPEIGKFLIEDLLKTVDSMIIGRVLYQGFEQYWPSVAKDPNAPKVLADFANWLADCPKFVFSNSLEKAAWNNTTLLHATNDEMVKTEIERIKQMPGGDLVIFGGVRMAQTLTKLGLVDEYRFKVQQVALGKGQQLFLGKTNLKLVFSKAFDSGVVASYYQPVATTEKK